MHFFHKLIFYLLLGFVSGVGSSKAQVRIDSFPRLEWYKVLAGYDLQDQVKDMEQGADGSIYYAGVYNTYLYVGALGQADTLYQAPSTQDPQLHHGYVVKVNSEGKFQWIWMITGDADSRSTVTDIALDGNGNLWVTGHYSGVVTVPYGGNFANSMDGDGFALKLDSMGNGSNFIPFWGSGNQEPKKIFPHQNGELTVILDRLSFPTVIALDTIEVASADRPFLGIVRMGDGGTLLDFRYVGLADSISGAGYCNSTMDAQGNLYLYLLTGGDSFADSCHLLWGNDTLTAQGYTIIKISSQNVVEWLSGTTYIIGNQAVQLEAIDEGELYLTADVYSSNRKSFVTKYSSRGNLLWHVEASGFEVYTGGIAVCKDFLYWSGRFRCDVNIDTVHFKIGDRQPWSSPAETGYLCVINHHTGKVVWVMSDETTDQIKGFGRIVADEDHNITVENNVKTTLCTIDTLTLQVTSVDVPYKTLVRFKGIEFPIWPEPNDSLPGIYPDFALWPNPTSAEVSLRIDEKWGEHTMLEIFGSDGRVLQRQQLEDLETILSLDHLSSELLLLRLTNTQNKHSVTKRLVLMH